MKKLLLFIPVLFYSCVNPSMERGFASIGEALAEVAVDLNGYAESITSDMAQIEEDIYLISQHIEKMQKDKELALILIEEILSGLSRTQELLDQAATKEQMQDLLEDVQELGEGIQVLWNLADFDADGVVNGLDQCFETPYGIPVTMFGCPLTDVDGDGVLNADDLCNETWGVEVDETGCEIIETGTTTNTI